MPNSHHDVNGELLRWMLKISHVRTDTNFFFLFFLVYCVADALYLLLCFFLSFALQHAERGQITNHAIYGHDLRICQPKIYRRKWNQIVRMFENFFSSIWFVRLNATIITFSLYVLHAHAQTEKRRIPEHNIVAAPINSSTNICVKVVFICALAHSSSVCMSACLNQILEFSTIDFSLQHYKYFK